MNIIKGKTKPKGLRIVIYGVPGSGKTTLASKIPNNLFLDFENGSHGLDVAKVDPKDNPKSYDEMKGIIDELKRDHQGFEHLTIDTADKCELVLSDALAKAKKVEDIFAIDDYGRTIALHKRNMASVLDNLTSLVNTGFDVIVLAHDTQRKVEPTEKNNGKTYDHAELRLSKSVASLFTDWADVIIYVAFKTFLVDNDSKGKKQHVEGGSRWAYCAYSNDWEAKHRACIELPDDCSMNKLAEILPKAIANAVDRTGGCNAEQMVVNEKIAAPTSSKPCTHGPTKSPTTGKTATPAPIAKKNDDAAQGVASSPEKPERDCIAQLRKLAANYEITPEQIMAYLAANPKVKERFGSLDGIAFIDLPDAIVSWLSKGIDKVAAKIKG